MVEPIKTITTSFPKINSEEKECLTCGNTGRTADNPFSCDDCGRVYEKKSLQEIVDNSKVYIPTRYEKSPWNPEIIEESLNKNVKDINIRGRNKSWVEIQKVLLEAVRMSKPVEGSFYLTGPANTSKTRWAYTMIASAISNNYQVEKLIDVIDIDFEMDLQDLLASDILILRLNNYKVGEAVEKLNYLIPKRADLDLMTVVISRMPFSYVSKMTDYITFDIKEISI